MKLGYKIKRHLRARSRLNELIAEIHKTKNEPYGNWLLQAYYYYRPYGASKKGGFLQELVSIDNPYGVCEKAYNYYRQKDNTNARIWFLKATNLGSYDGYFWLASTYFATDIKEYERLSQKAIYRNSFLSLTSSADFDYGRKGDFRNAIYDAEKAIKKGHPFKFTYAGAYLDLCRYYI
jgi:tetratricopeptide (TPR) repeat protein